MYMDNDKCKQFEGETPKDVRAPATSPSQGMGENEQKSNK